MPARSRAATTHPAAIVVAFDGLIAETHEARTLAIADALIAEGVSIDIADVRPLVLGRSLDETIETVLQRTAEAQRTVLDYTRRDLVVLRARRAYSAMVAHGLPLAIGAAAWITELAARGVRIVVRADSVRADVIPLLRCADLDDVVTCTICADDAPHARGDDTLLRAWRGVAARLDALRVDRASCRALEASARGATVARGVLDHVHEVSTLSEYVPGPTSAVATTVAPSLAAPTS